MKILVWKQFEDFLSRLTNVFDLKLFVIRYLVFFIGFLEIILLPIFLEPGFYTQVEFIKQFFLLLPLALFGIHSGYLYVYFADKRKLHMPLLLSGVFIGLVVSIVTFIYTGNIIFSFSTLFLLIAIVIEKILVSDGVLILASLYKAIVSGVLIVGSIIVYFSDFYITSFSFYSFSFVLGFVFWFALVLLFSNFLSTVRRPVAGYFISDCVRMIKSGFFVSLHTFLLIAYLLFDRYIVNKYYVNYSAEYALAFSLSQIVFIGINTVAYVSQHRIGVGFESMKKTDYLQLLDLVFRLFLVLFSIGLIACFVIMQFISNYGNFIISYVLISVLFGAYYVYSSVSSVGTYRGLATQSLVIFVLVFFTNIVATLLIVYFDSHYYVNVVKTGVLLLASAVFYHLFILRRVYL